MSMPALPDASNSSVINRSTSAKPPHIIHSRQTAYSMYSVHTQRDHSSSPTKSRKTMPLIPKSDNRKTHSRIRSYQTKPVSKNPKLLELEQENSSLKKELNKVQSLFNSALNQLALGKTSKNIVEDFLQQKAYIEVLQKENEKFKVIMKANSELAKNQLTLKKLAKKVIELEKENERLKDELVKSHRTVHLQSNLRSSQVFYVSLVKKLYRACCLKRLDIDELGYILNPNELPSIDVAYIQRGLKAIDVEASLSDVKQLVTSIIGYDVSSISQQKLIEGIKYLNVNCKDYSALKEDLYVLKLALASCGTTKNSLLEQYKAKEFTREELTDRLILDGLVINKEKLDEIFTIIFENNEKISAETGFNLLFGMFDEIPFQSWLEYDFEDEIIAKMQGKWEIFLEKCELIDKSNTSLIPILSFFEICSSLSVDFSSSLTDYLLVLFYNNSSSSTSAPYHYFYLKYHNSSSYSF
jgi:hypothetical protein